MKKLVKPTVRRLHLLSRDRLTAVTGGGLGGPDPCEGRYKIICIQDATPPSSQDC